MTPDLGAHAAEYARCGWEVFPLRGKMPAIGSPHPEGSPERADCKGECGLDGHGLFDATTDVAKVTAWWSRRNWNIGVRPPTSLFVLDVDDMETLARLESENGSLPTTLTTISGREAGGRHFWFWHPGGPIRARVIPKAIETKTRSGYLVMPPSIHPISGNRYRRIDAPVVAPPRWLVDLIRPPAPPIRSAPRAAALLSGGHTWGRSPADEFNAARTWAEILMPHGWTCLGSDTESDGARWVHPAATAKWSATLRHGLLFVYTTSTEFDTTDGAGTTKGYTKFRAYAVLNFPGATESERMSAATKSLIRSSR